MRKMGFAPASLPWNRAAIAAKLLTLGLCTNMRSLYRSLSRILPILSAIVATAAAQWTPMNPVTAVQQQSDGVVFTMHTGTLKLQVCAESVIHVLYSPTASFPDRKD